MSDDKIMLDKLKDSFSEMIVYKSPEKGKFFIC
jgi:hypothetical protein